MPFWQTEVSLFLSSPFQKFDEDPDNWWYTTIVFKFVTETLHALSTKWAFAFAVISSSINRSISRQLVIYKNRIKNCYWNTSRPFDKLRCRFSCHLHFKKSMKILTVDDIQQSYKKLLLKHFMPFWQTEVSLFLSSRSQIFGEDPVEWWWTTIVYEVDTQTIQALSKKLAVVFAVISISINRSTSWQLVIYKNRK